MPALISQIALLRTKEYFDRIALVTSEFKDKKSVYQFVEGVHDLGLWNSMVCWPMRSSQNALNDNVVYSLGGLGTYNGTLVNGPSIDVNGLTMLGSLSQSITIGDDSKLKRPDKVGLILVWSPANTANFPNFGTLFGKTPGGSTFLHNYHFQENSGTRQISFGCGDGVGSSSFQTATIGANTNKHCVIGSCLAGGQTKLKHNANAISSTANTLSQLGTSNANLRFMAGNPGASGGEFSFGGLFSTDLTDVQINFLYDLYKSTLGTGLGLP